jgi:hypothetical protein
MASLYQHRAFYSVTGDYKYWTSDLEFDSAGEDYVGPPAFGTLSDVAVMRTIIVNDPALIVVSLEQSSPDPLNEFDVVT